MFGSVKRVAGAAVAASLIVVALVLTAPAAEAASRRSLNITGYCRAAFYNPSVLSIKAVHGRDARSWRCSVQSLKKSGKVQYARNPASVFASLAPGWRNRVILPGHIDHYSFNPNDVCRWQYGSKWKAGLYAAGSWADWFCYQYRA